MEVIPAVDIKDGKCVRLEQGDFKKEKIYYDNPLEIALYWQKKGAKILHVVDLDGAKDGRPQNMSLIKNIAEELTIPVQVGGGIRNREVITEYLQSGMLRVIIGTLALEKPDLVSKLVNKFGADKIVAGIDARENYVAVKGWLETSERHVQDVIKDLRERGIYTFIYTDITKDGMLAGPDIEGLKKLKSLTGIEIIASGGVTTEEHIQKLQDIGIEYAIVGKALYTEKLNYEGLWGE